MKNTITPLSVLITPFAGLRNQRQDKTIDFLCEQVETYREIVGTGPASTHRLGRDFLSAENGLA